MQQIVHDIWEEKYKYGNEKSLSESVDRVVDGVYSLDSNEDEREHTRALVKKGYILPAGRIWAGAGTDKKVTLINCFVSPIIQDSMDTIPDQPGMGIMDTLKTTAITSQMGGGDGMDFSPIRPRGAIVKRTASVSSGVLPFMDMWDYTGDTIMSAGHRRVAQMGTLRIDHPDILEFITAKQELKLSSDPGKKNKSRLENFNISVLVTDAFKHALDNDEDWDLGFNVPRADANHVDAYQHPRDGKKFFVYYRMKARDLWNKIMESTYVHAEPGIQYIDRVNYWNNLYYCETIYTSNPCFAAETLIVTDKGAIPIEELCGKRATIWDGKKWVEIDTFRETGRDQRMLCIELQDGSTLRVTPYHQMILEDGSRCEAGKLTIGNKLQLSDVTYDGEIEEAGAYLKGFLLGDGSVSRGRRKPHLYLYEPKYCCMERLIKSAQELTPGKVNTNALSEIGFSIQETDTYERKIMTGLALLGAELYPWCKNYKDGLPLEVFQWNQKTKTEFLAGLFDADGTCMSSKNGYGYHLSSVNIKMLLDVQVLLKSIGVRSKLGLMKAAQWRKDLPGRSEGYNTQDCWRLVISQANSVTLASELSFSRLKSLADRELKYYCASRAGQVVSISDDGIDDIVYCCTVKGSHAVSLGIGVVTGQCGEQFLPPNGACNLGHINIAEMLINPFAGLSEINWDVLKQSCRALVRFLDNVLDVTKFPIKEQAEESFNKRRIGIGQTGYASGLYQLGIPYGSPDAVALMSQISYEKCIAVYEASSDLAVERGSFPLYDRDKFQAGNFVQKLPAWLREKIYKQGMRNGVLLSDAPVGTGSIVVGNVSSGIEPIFAHEYDRKVKNPDGHSFRQYKVYDYAVEKFRRMFPEKPFPKHFNTANDLTIDEHLQTAAAAQEWVDSAISKTVNCPESMSIEEFRDVYSKAYDMGLKGVTTYRPDKRSKRGSILSVGAEEAIPEHTVNIPISVPKIPREKVLDGRCYQIKWHTVPQAFYVIINDYVDEAGVRRPFEIFVTSKSVQSLEWITALTILATGIFRRGGDVSFVAEELKQVFSPTGGMFYSEKYRYVPSLVALIGIKLEEHLQWLGLIPSDEEGKTVEAKELSRMSSMSEAAEVCTKCHSKALFHEEGCKKCHSCGHSDCGG